MNCPKLLRRAGGGVKKLNDEAIALGRELQRLIWYPVGLLFTILYS